MSKVTKAIIAAAGYGTRFLPATKNVPKELLNIIDTPVLEYITEECVSAGITDIIIVTRFGNNSIEDYLDSSKELEEMLYEKGKDKLLERIRRAYSKANFIFVRQAATLPYGTATPLWVSKNLINKNESFAYLFGDDIFWGEQSAIKELIDSYNENSDKISGCLGAYPVPKEEIQKYGVFEYEEKDNVKIFKNVIEKPTLDQIKSNLARVGRFVYSSKIFDYFNFDYVQTNPRKEFELTDVENEFTKNHDLMIEDISGEWLPVGDPESYLRTTIKIAMKRPEFKHVVDELLGEDKKYL